MCDPAYSENNLNFRLVGVLQKLDTVRECIFVRTGFEHLYMPLGPARGETLFSD